MPYVIKKQNSELVVDRFVVDDAVSISYISIMSWGIIYEQYGEALEAIRDLVEKYGQAPLELKEIVVVNGIRKYVEK